MSTIGERVKAAREKCGIHQAELARRLGCSVNALSDGWKKMRLTRTPARPALSGLPRCPGCEMP